MDVAIFAVLAAIRKFQIPKDQQPLVVRTVNLLQDKVCPGHERFDFLSELEIIFEKNNQFQISVCTFQVNI